MRMNPIASERFSTPPTRWACRRRTRSRRVPLVWRSPPGRDRFAAPELSPVYRGLDARGVAGHVPHGGEAAQQHVPASAVPLSAMCACVPVSNQDTSSRCPPGARARRSSRISTRPPPSTTTVRRPVPPRWAIPTPPRSGRRRSSRRRARGPRTHRRTPARRRNNSRSPLPVAAIPSDPSERARPVAAG